MRDTDLDAEVSSLGADSTGRLIASGFQDGKVRLWDRASWTLRVALDGHRSAISSIAFSADGQLLTSASHDTDIIVWDCVAESGMFRLRGHKDAVTVVSFLPGEGSSRLVSDSKDSLIKVWEIDAQYCVQTITGHRSEVWSIATDSVSCQAAPTPNCASGPSTPRKTLIHFHLSAVYPKAGMGVLGDYHFAGPGDFCSARRWTKTFKSSACARARKQCAA